jgi:salicylate hydroxylase
MVADPDDPVLVAGAGIGGLVAALVLARAGRAVTLIERAPALTEVGAGLQIGPNAGRVVRALRLERALDRLACRPDAIAIRHWRRGTLIDRQPLADAEARWGAPYRHVHRADLIEVLAAAAAEEAGITLHLGRSLEGVAAAAEDGVRIDTDAGPLTGRALIGADGLRSTVREHLVGPRAPRWTGNVAWRTLIPAHRLPERLKGPEAGLWWGPGAHLVHYRVRAGAFVNLVAVVERDDGGEESWVQLGSRDELAADFAGWHPDVGTLIDAADADGCFRWALYDRPPLARWSSGAATLLGDAAHPTLPFLAQGAALAMEDAVVLGRCLAADEAPVAAFRHYEALRRPRTAAIQRASRRNARIFHLRGPAAWVRDRVAPRAARRTLAPIYAYDPLTTTL